MRGVTRYGLLLFGCSYYWHSETVERRESHDAALAIQQGDPLIEVLLTGEREVEKLRHRQSSPGCGGVDGGLRFAGAHGAQLGQLLHPLLDLRTALVVGLPPARTGAGLHAVQGLHYAAERLAVPSGVPRAHQDRAAPRQLAELRRGLAELRRVDLDGGDRHQAVHLEGDDDRPRLADRV